MEALIGVLGLIVAVIALIASIWFFVLGNRAMKSLSNVAVGIRTLLNDYSEALRMATQERTVEGIALLALEGGQEDGRLVTAGQIHQSASHLGHAWPQVVAALGELQSAGTVAYESPLRQESVVSLRLPSDSKALASSALVKRRGRDEA